MTSSLSSIFSIFYTVWGGTGKEKERNRDNCREETSTVLFLTYWLNSRWTHPLSWGFGYRMSWNANRNKSGKYLHFFFKLSKKSFMGQFENCGHNLLGVRCEQEEHPRTVKATEFFWENWGATKDQSAAFLLSFPSCCHTSGMRSTENVRCPLTTNTCRVWHIHFSIKSTPWY